MTRSGSRYDPRLRPTTVAARRMFAAGASIPEVAEKLRLDKQWAAELCADWRGATYGVLGHDWSLPSVERDRGFVSRIMAHGGLPRAVTLPGGRAAWIGPDDKPWRYLEAA